MPTNKRPTNGLRAFLGSAAAAIICAAGVALFWADAQPSVETARVETPSPRVHAQNATDPRALAIVLLPLQILTGGRLPPPQPAQPRRSRPERQER